MIMKKIKFIIALLGFPILFSGCLERELEERPSVPVRLYTGIQERGTPSRGLVDAFDGTPVAVACGSASGAYTEYWEGVATANEIILTPERYYPYDGSSIFVRGYYPPATLQNGVLRYKLTGQEDLMLSAECSGSLATPFTPTDGELLEYRHLLMQLNFNLRLEGDATSFSVRQMTLEGLTSNVTLDLATGKLTDDGTVSHIDVFKAPGGDQGLPAVNGEVEVPGYVLVQPGAELTLDLALALDNNPSHDRIYKDIPVLFSDEGGASGIAYSISLKVNTLLDVVATATVVPWQSGEEGSGSIKKED